MHERQNRIADVTPFPSPKVEIWDSDPAGHWQQLAFHLPKGISRIAVEAAFRDYGRRWIEQLDREGFRVRQVECLGPFPSPEFERLDQEVYVIRVRVQRMRPLLLPLDLAEQIITNQPTRRYPDLFKQFAVEQERNARRAAERRQSNAVHER